MQTDEQQIRALVATWMAATKAGDVETVLGLMTEDAVFLVPGKPAMRKSEFAAAARAQATGNAPTFDGSRISKRFKCLAIGPSCGASSQ